MRAAYKEMAFERKFPAQEAFSAFGAVKRLCHGGFGGRLARRERHVAVVNLFVTIETK